MEEIYSRPLLFGVVIDRRQTHKNYVNSIILVPVIRGSYRSSELMNL